MPHAKVKSGSYYARHKRRCLSTVKTYRARLKQADPEKLKQQDCRKTSKFSRTPKGVYRVLAGRSRKRRLPLLTQAEFVNWYKSAERKCVFCDIPESLCRLLPHRGSNNRLSIDRIKNSVGYVEGNLQLACLLCNRVKNDIFSNEEMYELAQQFITPKWKNLLLVS